MIRKFRTFACDFETTVYEGQTETEVWASALVELNTEDVQIFGSLNETFLYLKSLKENIMLYYHNLKFDGAFWISYLMTEQNYEQAYVVDERDELGNVVSGHFLEDKDMTNCTFKYLISDLGQWYTITIKVGGRLIIIRDSLKLLPFSIEKIGKSFGTKHKKLSMEYEGFRFAGCTITPEEQQYIANDVLVLKEALEIMFEEGHDKLTIGSCCMKEFKSGFDKQDWDMFFPDLYAIPLDEEEYGSKNAGNYIKRAYRGGWCYVARGKENIVKHGGCTADVNSLYPSMMSSESGNYYPVGEPHFWKGDIPWDDIQKNPDYPKYFFVRIKTRFYIKKDMLPFVQIKRNLCYKGTECLESSDVEIKGKKYKEYLNPDGTINDGRVTMTMTMTDYFLFRYHYACEDLEILDGCWFESEIGIFDRYMTKYKKIKMESTGAIRELAKLFLNNLYGKMATSTISSYKLAYVKEDGSIGFRSIWENNKKGGYIAIGAAITSYARCFTITAAQKNYHGKNERGFIYADTDSIHCDLPKDELVGIRIHPTDFCAWKIENEWDIGFFTRQKTYIEHVVVKDGTEQKHPYYDIKCAGMPVRCKYLYSVSLTGEIPEKMPYHLSEEDEQFIQKKRKITDFSKGLVVPGKLLPKRIKGGIVLKETTFEFR